MAQDSQLSGFKFELNDPLPVGNINNARFSQMKYISFIYKNYKGDVRRRFARFTSLEWNSTEYHKEPQYFQLTSP